MERDLLDRAAGLLEQANAALTPLVRSRGEDEILLRRYARLERLVAFGKATVAARLDDPIELARVTGTSVGKARETVATGRVMTTEPRLAAAMASGGVSLDQAGEIARTARVAPQAVDSLVETARSESFQVLKEQARQARVEAQDPVDLAVRQHDARSLRHWVGELGMVNLHATLEPQVGTPLISRLEDEANRLARASRQRGDEEPMDRHLADALPRLTEGEGGKPGKAELVVLVSHEVTRRGWEDVREGEHCKIPGIGPVAPQVAKAIAQDAFLTGVFYDGTDLRHLKRWTRSIPKAVRLALSLGEPPEFDGLRCSRCGNRFRIEIDHKIPYAAGGPTALPNSGPLCHACHIQKTIEDLRRHRHRQREQQGGSVSKSPLQGGLLPQPRSP